MTSSNTPSSSLAHNPLLYQNETYNAGLSFKTPSIPFTNSTWEGLARSALPASAFGYVHGSAGTGETDAKNRAAFAKWSIVPSRLVPADFPRLNTKVLGRDVLSPIAVAPVGVQTIFNPEGEVASAKAAREVGMPYIMSTASSKSIEEVARANGEGGERWFQLYWPANEHNDITLSMLRRARETGFSVLVVTLDTYTLGWRPADLDNGYNPFIRPDSIGVEIGFTDNVFRAMYKEEHGKEVEEDTEHAATEWAKIAFPGKSHGWEDLKFLQEHWDGPIVLKGIQTVADANKALEYGVQGIIVSNHGGRQTDGGVASLTMLPRVVDAVGDKLDVLFDSGIRCGADIVKALALGAKMVLVGRPYVYGLAIGGKDGVAHVLKSLLGDLHLTLHLSGIPSVEKEDLNSDRLIKEE